MSARSFPELVRRPDLQGRHPSAATADNVAQLSPEDDLGTLVNTLHQHSRCRPGACLRQQSNGELACRFGFPRPPLQAAAITTTVNERGRSEPRLQLARRAGRDELTNAYVPLVLRTFRANTDVQLILTRDAVVTYIAKYASKAEKTSASLVDIVKAIAAATEAERAELPVANAVDKPVATTVARRILA